MHKPNSQQQLLTDYILSNKENYYRLAYSYVKNTDDALDIVHESICKIYDLQANPCETGRS